MASDVLIADPDSRRAENIADACVTRGLAARTAQQGAEALEKAIAQPPDLVVAPVELPLIGAVKLAEILRANPRTRTVRFIFLGSPAAGAAPGDIRDEVMAIGAGSDEIASRVDALLTRQTEIESVDRPSEDDSDLSGKLSKIAFPDLLQLLHANRRTGLVSLTASARGREERGSVVLQNGEIVHATANGVEGEKALFRLLSWKEGTFAFTPRRVKVSRTIHTPVRALLLEGVRQLDEANRLESAFPSREAHVALRMRATDLPNMVHPLTQEVLLLLEIYSKVADVVDHCSFPDYQVLHTLQTLVERKIIEVREGTPRAVVSGGIFSPVQARRLRDWLEAGQPKGTPVRDAKLLLISSDATGTGDFVRLLRGLAGVRLEGAFAGGGFATTDLASIGRLPIDNEVGIEIIHVPADSDYAPLWPVTAHGALGILFLLSGRVAEAVRGIQDAVDALGALPRARLFYVMLLHKGDAHLSDELRENLSLIDSGSLFLVPVESGKAPAEVLRSLLARVLP